MERQLLCLAASVNIDMGANGYGLLAAIEIERERGNE